MIKTAKLPQGRFTIQGGRGVNFWIQKRICARFMNRAR